jgi:hypothetical protein
LQTGFIADSIGVSNAFIISGSAITLLGFCASFIPLLKDMSRKNNQAKDPE